MKNKILYTLFCFLLGSLSLWAQLQQQDSADPTAYDRPLWAMAAAPDGVGVTAGHQRTMEKVEQYIERTEEKMPHRSFWQQCCDELHQFLLVTSEQFFSPSIYKYVAYVLQVVFDIPVLILLIFLSLAFILNIFVVSVCLVAISFYKNGRELYKKKLNDELEQMLTEYLFYDADEERIVHKLKAVNSQTGKNVLVEILFNYQYNLSGEYRERILDLYKKLELYKMSEKRISSFYSHKRILGIRELANMYPSGAKNLIQKYVRDKNDMVRGEAQIAYAYLDKEASFDFLDELESPLSKWVQLHILNYVKLHEREVPSFDGWLGSSNNDVQDFSIRMINYFQQKENADLLLKMLDHLNPETRAYVYQAILGLNLYEAKAEILKRYEHETHKNKVEILRVLDVLADSSDIDFLAGIIRSDDVRLKLEATRVLYHLGDTGKAFLKEYSEAEDLSLNKYVEYIKDVRN